MPTRCRAESGAFAAWLLQQKASYAPLQFVLLDVKAGKTHGGGIEGESVTVTWKSQDPTPLPETGITKSNEAQVELVWLQTSEFGLETDNILQHSNYQSISAMCNVLPSLMMITVSSQTKWALIQLMY